MAIVDTNLLVPGIRAEFFDAVSNAQTFFERLSLRITSDKDTEKYRWLHQNPRPREWGTGRLAKGLGNESYDVENQKYELTLEVDRDELEDAQLPQITQRVRMMGESFATYKDFLIAQLLINGGSAGFVSFDGKTFFAADHESGLSGPQSNDLTFNVVDPNAPTTTELESAVEQAITTMMGIKDDNGESARLLPTGLALVVPPGLFFKMKKVVNTQVVNNTTNVFESVAEVIPLPDITDATKFYTLKIDRQMKPFIYQQRTEIELTELTESSEPGFLRDVWLFGARQRFRMAYGDWKLAQRTTLN